ncbi:hypothetical protein FisN_39Hh017 [Fistulifera solaris]|uniref:Sulfhydryl oxidase n=1 Tax=Fistulifera solaris TaxID=1519565 RepID=A0A1Z5KAA1_FISSO|nr:hypothetical protein FisN_39Hh017 [Fistulifera solaris]|eukprot:GAX23187.1 hypothetical protein FisN_39Hh017 [Fistulifera solaris]
MSQQIKAEKISTPESGYLYLGTTDSYPISDYDGNHGASGRPDFLYGSDTGPRVVEFYAPWCPHCKKMRPHYIAYAQRVTKLVNETAPGQEIKFYAISCVVHSMICKDYKITGYPRIFAFLPGQHTPAMDVFPKMPHPFELMDKLGLYVDEDTKLRNNYVPESESLADRVVSLMIRGEMSHPRSKRDTFHDAVLSFNFSMRNLFTTHGPLSDDASKTLHQWLSFLRKAIPRQLVEIHRVIDSVLNDFDSAIKSEENMVAILDRFPKPVRSDWSDSCTKGQSGMGYTCGLWDLFHIASIGIVEWNTNAREDRSKAVSAVDAGNVLRDFIAHFFGCDECRTNFLKAYDSCELDRCNRLRPTMITTAWNEFPFWLFEMHNAVNLRLMREQANEETRTLTEEDERRSQWPTRLECPGCFNNTNGSFIKEAVLQHLRIEYWPDDQITQEYRKRLGETLDGRQPHTMLFAITLLCGLVTLVLLLGYLVRKSLLRRRRNLNIKAN